MIFTQDYLREDGTKVSVFAQNLPSLFNEFCSVDNYAKVQYSDGHIEWFYYSPSDESKRIGKKGLLSVVAPHEILYCNDQLLKMVENENP